MSPLGFKHSPETRAKLSAAQKGKTHSPEARAKISAASKGRRHKGYPRSPETRARMSAAAKARKRASVRSLYGAKHYDRYRKYKLNPEAFDKMLAEQCNRCLVCGHEFTDANPPVIDHDHNCCPGTKTCGQCIGGLLHSNCNSALGKLHDDPEICLMAAIYLRTRRKRLAGDLESTPSLAAFYQAFLHIPSIAEPPLTAAIQ
jgi:hypothetical protein